MQTPTLDEALAGYEAARVEAERYQTSFPPIDAVAIAGKVRTEDGGDWTLCTALIWEIVWKTRRIQKEIALKRKVLGPM